MNIMSLAFEKKSNFLTINDFGFDECTCFILKQSHVNTEMLHLNIKETNGVCVDLTAVKGKYFSNHREIKLLQSFADVLAKPSMNPININSIPKLLSLDVLFRDTILDILDSALFDVNRYIDEHNENPNSVSFSSVYLALRASLRNNNNIAKLAYLASIPGIGVGIVENSTLANEVEQKLKELYELLVNKNLDEEIVKDLNLPPSEQNVKERLKQILGIPDLVKKEKYDFAKKIHNDSVNQIVSILKDANEFKAKNRKVSISNFLKILRR